MADNGMTRREFLQKGRTIVAVGGTPVASLDTLRAALAACDPGDRVVLRWRDTAGVGHRVSVVLGESAVA